MTAPVAPRQLVAPPSFSPRDYGLLSAVQPRFDEADSHWMNGVTFQDICGLAGTTFSPWCPSGSLAAPADKDGNVDVLTFGALPFWVMAEVDCSPVGYSQQEQRDRAMDALKRSEGYQVESVFATGQASNVANSVYPHLQANSAVTQGTTPVVRLQCAATQVSGGAAFEIVEGLGRLEAAMAACYTGQVTLHVPYVLGPRLISSALVKSDGAQLKTASGSIVALGSGYPGSAPDGTASATSAWIYATGPVFAYRGSAVTFKFSEMFDREANLLRTIVERPYLVGFACCCMYAVRIALPGGVPL